MKLFKSLLFLISIIFINNSQSFAQTHDLITSEISFNVKNAGITINGTFKAPVVALRLDKRKYHKMTLSGTLEANTIKTGIKIRDKHLCKIDYFDVENFPKIYMKSQSFSVEGTNKFKGVFILKIKDIEKPVKVNIDFVDYGETISINNTFSINRKDFSLGGNSLTLSDTVNIIVKCTFIKK